MKRINKGLIKKLSLSTVTVFTALALFLQNVFAVNEWWYTVRSGDTVSQIAERELELSWYRTNIQDIIRALNPGINVDRIRCGQQILLPEGRRRERLRLEQEARERETQLKREADARAQREAEAVRLREQERAAKAKLMAEEQEQAGIGIKAQQEAQTEAMNQEQEARKLSERINILTQTAIQAANQAELLMKSGEKVGAEESSQIAAQAQKQAEIAAKTADEVQKLVQTAVPILEKAQKQLQIAAQAEPKAALAAIASARARAESTTLGVTKLVEQIKIYVSTVTQAGEQTREAAKLASQSAQMVQISAKKKAEAEQKLKLEIEAKERADAEAAALQIQQTRQLQMQTIGKKRTNQNILIEPSKFQDGQDKDITI